MKKAVVFFVCLLGVAGFMFLGVPHVTKASASQDGQKVASSHSKMQEVAGYGESSNDGQDSSGYGSSSDEGTSGGDTNSTGDDSGGDSGSDSGGYGN